MFIIKKGKVWGSRLLRLLEKKPKKSDVLDGSGVGLSKKDLSTFREVTAPGGHGLVLFSGPKSSGKTATIYHVLEEMQKNEMFVVSTENPVEEKIEDVHQVSLSKDQTHNESIKDLLRRDPDAVYVSELDDLETIETVLVAGLTGHIMLSSAESSSAAEALVDIVNSGAPVEDITPGSFATVVFQRLLPKLCEQCKQQIGTIYVPVGCETCDSTGYNDSVPIFEVIKVTDEIIDIALRNGSLDSIEKEARKNGFTTMYEDGLRHVTEGKTTIEDLLNI